MAKPNIIKNYRKDLENIETEKIQIVDLMPAIEIRISEIKSPIAQLDEAIAELTVDVNKKIKNISLVSIAGTNCGCGKTELVLVTTLGIPEYIVASSGTIYYYEHAKTLRMNAENRLYTGTNPFSPLDGTDGSTNFNSGIGSDTIVVDANSNAILEILVVNGGSGYASTLSPYYTKPLSGGTGTNALVDVIVGTSGTVTNVVVSNGGSGYTVGDVVTVSGFSGANFKITDVGSPILGVGTETYIVASSGVGSVFVQDMDTLKISTCATTCSTYNNQINTLVTELNTLRTQRQILIDASNSLKNESKRFFVQRYAYSFSRGQLDLRKSEINSVINVLESNTYDSYFT